MGFIAFQQLPSDGSRRGLRIYLECQEPAGEVDQPHRADWSYSYAIDVWFAAGHSGCRLGGVDDILALKKFYKLVFSLEERAREQGGDWRGVFASDQALLHYLELTRNARRVDSHSRMVRRGAPIIPSV